MSPGAHCDYNMSRPLNRGGDVSSNQIQVGAAGAFKAVFVALYAVQQNAGFVNAVQGCLCKRHGIVQAYLASGQLNVRGTGFADSSPAQHRDGEVFQILHFAHS